MFAVATLAFLGSLGHCVGMCGGFVLAYSSKIDNKSSKIHNILYHLAYNVGRISSYIIMGIVFGYIGSIFSFSKTAEGYLFFLIGCFMFFMGLSLTGKIKFLVYLENIFSTYGIIKRVFSRLIQNKSFYSFFGLGMLNGFLPCGLSYNGLIFATLSMSWFYGGLIMFVFGVFTMPVMMGLGYFVRFLQNTSFREFMIRIIGIIVMIYGVYMSYLGFMATRG